MHHYPFNIGDYRKDTGHLSLLEHGIYRMLIDSYYENEGPLRADDERIMRTHCIRSADEVQAYKNVLSDFFNEEDGYYKHDGCDKVLQKIFEKSEKARKSAEERWNRKNKGLKNKESERNANAMRTHSEGNANGMLPNTHNPIPNTHSSNGASADADTPPPKKSPNDYPEEFEAIWKAYPKREGNNPKNKAFSAYKARLAEGVKPEVMAAGVARYAEFTSAKGSIGTEFVMQGQRFFGKERAFENDWTVAEVNHAAGQPGFARRSKSDEADEAMRRWLREQGYSDDAGESLEDSAIVEIGERRSGQH